jgi:hypothetical protein
MNCPHHFEQIAHLCPLLSLPRELRDEIYAMVIMIHDSEDRPFVCIREDSTPRQTPPALLLTCKQIYLEAQPFYIKCLKLVIPDDTCLESTQQWLVKQQPQAVRRNVKYVAFTNVAIFRAVSPRERCLECKRPDRIPGPSATNSNLLFQSERFFNRQCGGHSRSRSFLSIPSRSTTHSNRLDYQVLLDRSRKS